MKHFQHFLPAALLFFTAVLPAHGQTVEPVPAATIITSAPYTISKAGFYQLGANLTYAGNGSTNDAIITINAPNVTLDFGGHYISGNANTASTLYGVYSNGQGNLTIQNGTISHCYEGIYLTGATSGTSTNFNQTIRNVLVTHSYYAGIRLDYPATSLVSNCQVSFIGSPAVEGDVYGIVFNGNVGPGCQVNNNSVTSVVASDGSALGISASGSTFTGNTVDTITGGNGGSGYGLLDANLVLGNKVSNCTYGIFGCIKYQNNLTYNCTNPFYVDTTDAGGNN